MIHRPVLDSCLKKITLAALALITLGQILVWRPLFADGAFLLMRILDTRRFHDSNEPSRVFDYWFTQFPTVFAIKLGVTNLHFLTHLFTAWMILCFMLFWMGTLWLLRKDFLFWPFTALFIVAYFNGGFFTVGEYNLDYALSAFCGAVMLRRRANSKALYAGLFFAAALSTFTYASTLFLGGILAIIAYVRYRREARPKMGLYWAALIGLFILSVVIGGWGYFDPNHPLNKLRASSLYALYNDSQFWLITGFALLATGQWLLPSKSGREVLFLGMAGFALAILSGVFLTHPSMDFAIRVYTGLALGAGLAVLGWFRFGGYRRAMTAETLQSYDPVRLYAVPVFSLLLILCLFDLSRSRDFGLYLNEFRTQVNGHTGVIAWEESIAGKAGDSVFGWSWTYPSMSLVLRRDSHAAIIQNARRNTEEQPFEPAQPPDLSRYYR